MAGPRNPLAIESPATRRKREESIRRSLREGADAGYLTSLFRRDVLVERAVRGMHQRLEVQFVSNIFGPVLRSVAGYLTTRPESAPLIVVEVGTPPLPPAREAVPAPLVTALDRILANGGQPMIATLRSDLEELAHQEVAFVAKAAVRHFGAENLKSALATTPATSGPEPMTGPLVPPAAHPVANAIVQRAQAAPMLGAVVEKTWGKALGGLKSRVEQVVGDGLARGQTTDQIVQALRGTRAQNYQDGVLVKWKSQNIRTFVRTAATNAVTQAREGSYAALGAPYVRLVATLDLRTTPICVLLDGTVYKVGEGPRPPLHPGCRTAVAPAWDVEPRDYGGKRASRFGPVSDITTARDLFLRHTEEEQASMVGKTRAEAIRSGKIEWRQMFGPSLEFLTLADLRAKGLLAG